ncbi:hypothetical protein XM72_c11694 [Vibrio vulnificus]|uniref:hypothetical protein n=1 Tax=Vibrio vulnificus TaxID=672 RepID=UPI0009CE8179|nr:hypothetical protein [Vibrio vulnificus]OQK41958.1 hypothetical protein XM72_c11694 [Vibrio vulnificus]
MKRIISIAAIAVVSGCASISPENWTYSEKVDRFENRVFVEAWYTDGTENGGLSISCDKGGENEIFTKFIAPKNEGYLLFPDSSGAKFHFVIEDVLNVTTSGFYIYDLQDKVFVGYTNKLPRLLLNTMGDPSLSKKQLHVRMTVEGVHIKAFKRAIDSGEDIKTNEDSLKWVKDNSTTQGIKHHFEKHVELKGFAQYIENYNGCTVSNK